jgi:hypothetical protein
VDAGDLPGQVRAPMSAGNETSAAPVAPSAVAKMQRISVRSVIIGFLLLPLNAWWLAQIEYVRYSDNATTSALFFNAVSVLLVITALNGAIRRVAPSRTLSRVELLTIYIIVVIGSAIGGHDNLAILFGTIAYVVRGATPENAWAVHIHPLLPKHLVVTDLSVLDPLFRGDSTLYDPARLRAWSGPILRWTLFASLVTWTMMCMAAIFRRQWDAERLNYPIVETPLEITSPKTKLFSRPLMWIGFGIGMSLQFINLAHTLWPAVPEVPIHVRLLNFNGMPWSAANPIPLSMFPFAFGLSYMLPQQLAFSCWFFFLVARLEMVATAAVGYTEWGRFPYVQQQGVGAYYGVALFVLWAARGHLRNVWLPATGRVPASGRIDATEPFPYAWAFWGFIVGLVGLIWFSVEAGMSLTTALIFFGLWIPIVLTMARLRAELGLPTIELYQVGAEDIMQKIAGTAAFSRRDLTVMTLYFYLTRTHRQFPMCSFVDAFRIGDRTNAKLRSLAPVMVAACVLAILCAFWAYLHVVYHVGYESAKFAPILVWAFGKDPWQKLDSWLVSPRRPDYGACGAYLFGIAFTGFLAYMRTRFVWWPFHPAGYLVSGSFGLMRLWLPIFATWLIKAVLLRYGGLGSYRKAQPLFIGLILGEFSAGFLRTVIDLVFNLHLPPESGIGGL